MPLLTLTHECLQMARAQQAFFTGNARHRSLQQGVACVPLKAVVNNSMESTSTIVLQIGDTRRSERLCCKLKRDLATSGPLEPSTAIAMPDREEGLGEILVTPTPLERVQPALSEERRRQLRAISEGLAREKVLARARIGKKRITRQFLNDCGDLLQHHEIVRVHVSDTSGLHRDFAAEILEVMLDCVCVQKAGKSFSIYRDRTLPRPVSSQERELSVEA